MAGGVGSDLVHQLVQLLGAVAPCQQQPDDVGRVRSLRIREAEQGLKPKAWGAESC